MSRLEPKWIRNRTKDGDMPACPYCDKLYEDAARFDIKNYPDDGMAAIFFSCENCKKEAQIIIEWSKIRENKYDKT